MNLQIIKSVDGKDEYVLLPIHLYHAMHDDIQKRLKQIKPEDDFVEFDPADYVDNPIALTRIKAGMTQKELAKKMGVTQAYISKIEAQDKVSAKTLFNVKKALKKWQL